MSDHFLFPYYFNVHILILHFFFVFQLLLPVLPSTTIPVVDSEEPRGNILPLQDRIYGSSYVIFDKCDVVAYLPCQIAFTLNIILQLIIGINTFLLVTVLMMANVTTIV